MVVVFTFRAGLLQCGLIWIPRAPVNHLLT